MAEHLAEELKSPLPSPSPSPVPPKDMESGKVEGVQPPESEMGDSVETKENIATATESIPEQTATGDSEAATAEGEETKSEDSSEKKSKVLDDEAVTDNEDDEFIARDLRMSTYHDGESLKSRMVKKEKRLMQSSLYLRLLEDRLSYLETELKAMKKQPRESEAEAEFEAEGEGGTKDKPVKQKGPTVGIDYQGWRPFQAIERDNSKVFIIELLNEEPGTKRKKDTTKDTGQDGALSTTKDFADAPKRRRDGPYRIRIHSSAICNLLKEHGRISSIMSSSITLLRPYKVFYWYEQHLRKEIQNTVAKVEEAKRLEEVATKVSDEKVQPDDKSKDNADDDGTDAKLEIENAKAALEHYRVLEELLDKHLKEQLEFHRQIRETFVPTKKLAEPQTTNVQSVLPSTLESPLSPERTGLEPPLKEANIPGPTTAKKSMTITFANLWLLYDCGDIVYTEDQAFRVVHVSGARRLNREKAVNYRDEKIGDEDGQPIYRSYETFSPLEIHCYSYSFDGREYGVVKKVFRIPMFEGDRAVTTLPLWPAGIAEEMRLKQKLISRGKLFVELAKDGQDFSHMQYDGIAVAIDDESEEANSQVIIDFTTAFRKHSKWHPRFGFDRSFARDAREQTPDCNGHEGNDPSRFECIWCSYDGTVEDFEIERQRSLEFIDTWEEKLSKLRKAKDFGEEELMLFPKTVYGFILRSRKWAKLDIGSITPVAPSDESFSDLVIPQRHKEIVEALVKTHSRGTMGMRKRNTDFAKIERKQIDLVRGKGQGIIILLHGPPGVGKTSTAECVADICQRPLFQITCGDIGVEPGDVEKNLDDSFRLAHRWGCVLLLDEADVFLQERNRIDLKRNSLVSVFLRVLEYYPGILFLTTNRIGTFDEAFKSRIHISLHYPRLNRTSSIQVWRNYINRLKERYELDEREILDWAEKNIEKLNWNGRQIKNGIHAAIALAEYRSIQKREKKSGGSTNSKPPSRFKVPVKFFKEVAKASLGFNDYLQQIYGLTDEQRALDDRYRHEVAGEGLAEQGPLFPTPKKKGKKTKQVEIIEDTSDSESSSSSGEESSSESSDSDSEGEQETMPVVAKKSKKDRMPVVVEDSKKSKKSSSSKKASKSKKKGKKEDEEVAAAVDISPKKSKKGSKGKEVEVEDEDEDGDTSEEDTSSSDEDDETPEPEEEVKKVKKGKKSAVV